MCRQTWTHGLDTSSSPSQRRRMNAPSSEVTVPRVWSINPTRRPCRNELDGDGACHDGAFVPEEVHMVTTWIDKPHPLCVHSGRAGGIVTFIGRNCSRRDDDEAMARVRVPARASAVRLRYVLRLPDVALYVHV